MFGYSKDDEKEKENVEKMFNETDIDGGGYLDKEEIRGLTKKLEIDFTDDQLRTAMKEMDPDGTNQVDFEEFEEWWFLKKNGVKRPPYAPGQQTHAHTYTHAHTHSAVPTCDLVGRDLTSRVSVGCRQAPMAFLQEVAAAMEVKALSPGDPVLECGEYGDALKIVLTGTVEVVQRDPLWREGKTEHEMLQRTINSTKDREPVFGLSAVGPRNPLGPSWLHKPLLPEI